MNGSEHTKVNYETDLGVTISNDFKPDKQGSNIVKKANILVGFIGKKTFKYKCEKKLSLHYNNALVRSHLEYCIQFYLPYNKIKRY